MTIPYTGFSPDYVYREAKRAIAGAAGTKITIWPGIDIDIPRARIIARARPEARVTRFWRRSGRERVASYFPEMKLANLTGAGDAIRQLGFA